jgi:glycosyltransferase involved in cell wall biosynthesis
MSINQNQILLSICIPTYNRANFLSNTLLAIAPQVDQYCNICELIISDNASEDETKNIIKEYQNHYKGIQYFVNPQNLGGRQNIWKVTTYATGKYIWILGDDDMPTPGAVSQNLVI